MKIISNQFQVCHFEMRSLNEVFEETQNLDLNVNIYFLFIGSQHSYHSIWKLQKDLHELRVIDKIPNIVLLLEHDHVYTFGKNSNPNHLLQCRPKDAEVVQIDRGGDLTYHGPGQLVGYPILNLKEFKKSISWYMRTLEDVIISTLSVFDIIAERKDGLTGVWVKDEKICAMGVRIAKWTTMHGFALNLNPDMKYFDGMIPCGIFEYGVTSISNFLNNPPTMKRLSDVLVFQFQDKIINNLNNETARVLKTATA